MAFLDLHLPVLSVPGKYFSAEYFSKKYLFMEYFSADKISRMWLSLICIYPYFLYHLLSYLFTICLSKKKYICC